MPRTTDELTAFRITSTTIGADLDEALRSDDWIEAVTPGGVHESLLAAGRIEHPYRDDHEQSIRWIEERDWWYRTDFTGPGNVGESERLTLRFLGLDTVARVWLNGEELGSHENMFRPASFDVTDRVREENVLVIRFSPPLYGLEVPDSASGMFARLGEVFASLMEDESSSEGGGEGLGSEMLPLSTLRRKATFSWGWDFGPRVPSIGIWRPAFLVREDVATISGHHLRTDRIDENGSAHLTAVVDVDRVTEEPLTAVVTVTTPTGEAHRVEMPIGDDSTGSATFTIPDAALWWTHDLGEPALHEVSIELITAGRLVDEVHDRVGLRTITLDQSADPEGGHRFGFVLNGVPIFARGAAWLPADMLVGSVDDDRYRHLVSLARDGGMNMLRIWGGGIYEHDAFYANCDALGVLVWHDFMFACIDYPSELPDLQAEVAAEAEYQVRRLRNRASIALWCGNNEVQLIHGFAYQNYEPGNWGWDFFHRILPDTVQTHDPTTPYWPGSPWGEAAAEGFMAVNGVLDGDRHAWEVWHGLDFGAGGGEFASIGESRHYRRYALDRGKFISEFGIHASPERSTLERWITPESLVVHGPVFDAHNKDNPKNKGDAIMEIITGVPATIDEYVDFTMVSQAEGLKFGIEHYRRRQPSNNGTLVWQFNDVWPGFSWSIIDYDGVPKAGYYFARRAFAPLLASFRYEDERLELWLSNSGRDARDIDADFSIEGFDGTVRESAQVTTTVGAADSVKVWEREGALGAADVAWVRSPAAAFPANRLFFGEIRDLPLHAAALEIDITRTGAQSADIMISSPVHTYLVRVLSPEPGVRFSDNYVDIAAGSSTTIAVDGLSDDCDPALLEVRAYIASGVVGG